MFYRIVVPRGRSSNNFSRATVPLQSHGAITNKKRILLFGLLAALLTLSTSAAAKVYPFQGPLYETVAGPYTTSMRVTGSIETSEPLPASNPSADRTAIIPAYSFNDGVVTTINGLPGGIGANAMDLSIGLSSDPINSPSFTTTGTFILANALCTFNGYDNADNFASAGNGLEFIGVLPTTQLPILSPFGLLLLAGGVVAVGAMATRHQVRT